MKLLSINVSQPREIDWQGRKVRTSIFKTPVGNRRHVGKLNIEGDAQSDLLAHGGEHRAVFVYQKESYDYWRTLFGRNDLSYGQFGENLTVEGLPDDEVCIGDRYRIGTVILEVTQPRVTCYKVAISTGIRDMPALLVTHKRPGFYCRVIEEGDVVIGDAIVKLSGGEGQMSIAEVDALLYSSKHPADRLLKVLSVKALSKGWHDSLQVLYDTVATGGTGNPGLAPVQFAWQGFLPFRVSKITVESEDVRSFELTASEGRQLPRFVPGEHIVVRVPGLPRPLIRMYSLCGPPNPDYYRIAVKAEPNGLAGNYLHHVLQPGQTLEISAPRGGFTLADSLSPLVLIGAGIGITPLLAMLYAVDNGREVHWIYTTRNTAHYPFQAEVQRVSANLPRFRSQIFFTRPTAGEAPGRLTPEVLKQLRLPADGDYYLCGPQGFMSAVTTALTTLGIPAKAIRQEAFGNSIQAAAGASGDQSVIAGKQPHLPAGAEGAGPLVTFAKTGLSFHWSDRFASLLEAAEACDVPVSWSCRVGVCHRCETTLFAGETSYTTPPLDPPGGGNILLCCSTPRSDCQLDL